MVGNTATQTKADRDRLSAISEMRTCLCCALEGWHDVPVTIHHITQAGRRMKDEHQHTLGLCAWHHLGIYNQGMSRKAAESHFGPSLAHSKALFHERYGTELQLLQVQDALVRSYYADTRRGKYLPPEKIGRLTALLWDEICRGRVLPRRVKDI